MDIVLFVLGRLLTRAFWYLVAVTFIGVLMMAARSQLRNEIFQAGARTLGRRY